jgi:hypothetical protein
MAKINHLNRKKTDGFIEALLHARPDLAGLPMAMGDTCRTKGDRTHYFTEALATIKRAKGQGAEPSRAQEASRIIADLRVRQAHLQAEEAKLAHIEHSNSSKERPQSASGGGDLARLQTVKREMALSRIEEESLLRAEALNLAARTSLGLTRIAPDAFWDNFRQLCDKDDKSISQLGQSLQEHAIIARIAALMQVLAPESVAMRKGLVKYLAATSHAEATRALAKLAIFSSEDEVRNPAIDALKVRREKDYSDVLIRGLRYPLPAVAKRATEAMTKLERTDLVPELVSFLDEPDPRSPTIQEVGGQKVPVMRELVRINHHRNCLMCHSPAVQGEVPPAVTTAEVPRPDQPLPFPSDGYQNSIPDVLVRLDVTYLRQDFSIMQPVADANPWPEMQRFDFLVRNRVITEEEANAFPAAAGLSPYQRFALAALRELTGRDTTPTPEAWRKRLDLPARGSL